MRVRRGRPTVVVIDRGALRTNLAGIRALAGENTPICAVIKADAYGHGAKEVARVLEKEGVTSFGVATVDEGVEVREAGVVHPEILVLGGFVAEEVEAILRHRLSPMILGLEMANVLQERLRGAPRALPVHVKVDTGLGRLGITLPDLPDFLERLKGLRGIEVYGLASHLGSAVEVTGEKIDRQMAAFQRAFELFAIHGTPAKMRHIANSAAVLDRPDLCFDMVRPGLILYGVHPGGRPEGSPFRPAMSFRTAVLQLRRLPEGAGIGYDQTFVTGRDCVIASLPVGYADGYPRALSNRGEVLVQGKRAPVVGRVHMDTTLVDVTDIPDVHIGDDVVLWGRQGEEEILVDEVAEWAGSIPYELLVGISRRVRRMYFN